MKKNLDRFIGVGLGTMLGQLTMGISCDISMDVGGSDDAIAKLPSLTDACNISTYFEPPIWPVVTRAKEPSWRVASFCWPTSAWNLAVE